MISMIISSSTIIISGSINIIIIIIIIITIIIIINIITIIIIIIIIIIILFVLHYIPIRIISLHLGGITSINCSFFLDVMHIEMVPHDPQDHLSVSPA